MNKFPEILSEGYGRKDERAVGVCDQSDQSTNNRFWTLLPLFAPVQPLFRPKPPRSPGPTQSNQIKARDQADQREIQSQSEWIKVNQTN